MILTLSIIVVVLALGGHSLATVPGPNGRIVWGSFNPDIGDADIYTANPYGTHETRVAGFSECPLVAGRKSNSSSRDHHYQLGRFEPGPIRFSDDTELWLRSLVTRWFASRF
jgi:hypothetical protein